MVAGQSLGWQVKIYRKMMGRNQNKIYSSSWCRCALYLRYTLIALDEQA
jgi:hypothetical protein